MKVDWTKGLPPKEEEDMRKAVSSARIPFKRLEKLVQEFISNLATTLPADFKAPQWALERAYKDGQIYAFNRILDLIKD